MLTLLLQWTTRISKLQIKRVWPSCEHLWSLKWTCEHISSLEWRYRKDDQLSSNSSASDSCEMPGFLRATLRHEAWDGKVGNISFPFCILHQPESCKGSWIFLSTTTTIISTTSTFSKTEENPEWSPEEWGRQSSWKERTRRHKLKPRMLQT